MLLAKYVKGQEGTAKVHPVRQSMREYAQSITSSDFQFRVLHKKKTLLKFDYRDNKRKIERYKNPTQVH